MGAAQKVPVSYFPGLHDSRTLLVFPRLPAGRFVNHLLQNNNSIVLSWCTRNFSEDRLSKEMLNQGMPCINSVLLRYHENRVDAAQTISDDFSVSGDGPGQL